jgi:hypothetical protein
MCQHLLAKLYQGTLDGMLYGSPWEPPDEVRENVGQYVDQVVRTLKPAGRLIYITWRQPQFVGPRLFREGIWDFEVERLEDSPGSFTYHAYITTKLIDQQSAATWISKQ